MERSEAFVLRDSSAGVFRRTTLDADSFPSSISGEDEMLLAGGCLRAVVLGIFGFCFVQAGAQVTANLSGRVTDPSGAAVTGATVTANDTETGIARTTLTDPGGQYHLFELSVGHYEVRASKDGFAERVRGGIVLVVGQDATADLSLGLR